MGATFVNITGQGYRAIAAQSDSWTVVLGENGTEVYPTDSVIVPDTRTEERELSDRVALGIVFLAGILAIAFLGIENVPVGALIAWDYVVTVGQGIAQILSAVFFHDVIPGPIAEDDTIHVIIFTVRDYLGLGNETGIAPIVRSINPFAL
jgi:hypothetical protein